MGKASRAESGQFLGRNETRPERRRANEEAAIQRTFMTWARLCLRADVLVFSIPNEGARGAAQTANLVAMGLRRGAADVCLIHAGRPYFLEFKSPTGSVRRDQADFLRDAETAGASIAVVRSSEEAIRRVKAWGIPHRETPNGD